MDDTKKKHWRRNEKIRSNGSDPKGRQPNSCHKKFGFLIMSAKPLHINVQDKHIRSFGNKCQYKNWTESVCYQAVLVQKEPTQKWHKSDLLFMFK